MGLVNNQVYLEKNHDVWKKMFEEERQKLIKIFNQDSFLIEHVGSTSIKGLLAKPIVDILVGIPSFDDIKKYLNTLTKMYTIKENYDIGEILLISENEEETSYLIHIVPFTGNRYQNMINFRDILDNNPEVLKQYEKLKIKLAKRYSNNREMYTKSKNDFINDVLKKHKETWRKYEKRK